MPQRVTDEQAREWWRPALCDASYFARLRADYPEDASMSDEELHEKYNEGRKYQCLWDHVGEAYGDWEQLADAFLDARAEVASLRTKLDAVCDAAEDAIGYAHQHDSDGLITFIDRSQPIAQYSDDGPDAWPARLHAALAAAREGK